ncbi:MAG: RNA polymerase sigma factor [bacterium]
MMKDFLDFLNQCIKNDEYAWDTFVKKYSMFMIHSIRKALIKYNFQNQDNEIEEILHRIFVTLLDKNCRRLKNFRGEDEYSFLAYLKKICFHYAIDYLRAQRNHVELEKVSCYLSETGKDTMVINKIDREHLRNIFLTIKDDLPERHKYMFCLIYEEGWKLKDIAHIMNLTPNATHQLKTRVMNNVIKIAKKNNMYDQLKYWPCLN